MSRSSKPIVVKSSDGETFEIDEAVASQSQIIKNMIEDGCADGVIPLPNVTSRILSKIIEYCEKHVESSETKKDHDAAEADLKTFDAEFMRSMTDYDDPNPKKYVYRGLLGSAFFADIFQAAIYLDIKGLDDLCAESARNDIPNLANFMPSEEEEAEIRRENAWAFD